MRGPTLTGPTGPKIFLKSICPFAAVYILLLDWSEGKHLATFISFGPKIFPGENTYRVITRFQRQFLNLGYSESDWDICHNWSGSQLSKSQVIGYYKVASRNLRR